MNFEVEKYHNNIVNNIKEIETVTGFFSKIMWTENEHRESVRIFNLIFNKNERVVGCSACREKIRQGLIQTFEYINKNNINGTESNGC